MATQEDTDLQVIQTELAGGLLVELQGDLEFVQLFPQASKLFEVTIGHLQQLPDFECIGDVNERTGKQHRILFLEAGKLLEVTIGHLRQLLGFGQSWKSENFIKETGESESEQVTICLVVQAIC